MKSIFFLRPKIITLYVIISFVFMSCVSFQNKAPLNKDIEQGQLKNGLSYYLMPHHFPKNRCFLRLNVKVGSFNENNDELGIAHLIEHLAFENRVMGEDKELAVWFQEQGMSFGPDANAYTTIDHTVYHMDLTNCEEQSIKDGLNIMRSFLDSIKFDNALIKKQKLIIDKEQQDYLNNLNKLNKTISHKLFAGTLFDTRPVLGEKAIRDTIDREKLEAFYKKWYRANNAQIVLVGDIDVLQVKELLNQSFMSLKPSTESPALPNVGRPSFQEAVIVASSPEIKSVETIFILQPPSLDMKAPSLDSLKAQLSFELAISMLRESITNKSAKQYPDELSPAEIYGLFGASQLPELSLKVSSNKENQPQVFKRAFSPIKRVLDHGFDKAQFKRALDNKLDAIEQSITEDITATSNSWAKAIVDHINQRSIALDAKTIAVTIKATLKKITPKDCSNELKKLSKNQINIFYLSVT
jgi:zinc protease